MAPMDGIGVVAEMIIGKLLQPFQLGVDGGGAGEVSVEGGWLDVHRRLRVVIDDATIQALNDQEAKLNSMYFHHLPMRIASNTGRAFGNLLNCGLCDLVRLYAVHFNLDGVCK